MLPFVVVANAQVAWIGSWSYLRADRPLPAGLAAFQGLALAAMSLELFVAAGLVLLPLARRRERVARVAGPALFALLQVGLRLDETLWGIAGRHLDGVAFRYLVTPGGLRAIDLSADDVLRFVWTLLVALALEIAAIELLRRGSFLRWRRGFRWLAAAAAVLFVAERADFAVLEGRNGPWVRVALFALPLHPSIASPWSAKARGSRVPQPRHAPSMALAFTPPASTPDVVWLLIDGWRADSLGSGLTPHLDAFARGATTFASQWSGANWTDLSLFAMLYGLPADAMWKVTGAGLSPALLARARALGYDVRLWCPTKFVLPSTKVMLQDVGTVHAGDLPGARLADQDSAMADDARAFLSAPRAAPRFAILLFESAHPRADYPDSCARFRPDDDLGASYTSASRLARTAIARNRYRNGLCWVDELADRVLSAAAPDAVVMITADHGQEFGELGEEEFGGQLDPIQLRVPLVLRAPGRSASVAPGPTSHLQIAATFLAMLGAVDPGPTLFDGARPWTVGCNGGRCAVFGSAGSIEFDSRGAPDPIELRDTDWRALPPGDPRLAPLEPAMIDVRARIAAAPR